MTTTLKIVCYLNKVQKLIKTTEHKIKTMSEDNPNTKNDENVDLEVVKNQIKYLLQQYSKGLKFRELADEFEEKYGFPLDPAIFKCNNLLNLFTLLEDIVIIEKYKNVRLKNEIFDDPTQKIVFDNLDHFKPHIYDDVKVGDYFQCKIHSVYDPSKFWIVIKSQEFDYFQEHWRLFYSNPKNLIRIPKNQIKAGKSCVVSTNDIFYRCTIQESILKKDLIRVFYVDYGIIMTSSINDVYYIHEHISKVPRFAIRAMLANICPYNTGFMWTNEDLGQFWKLISKQNLFARVCLVDKNNNVLHVAIRTLCYHYCDYINDILIKNNVAKTIKTENDSDKKNLQIQLGKYKSKVKYIYLYPSFNLIEKGGVPKSLIEFNLVRKSIRLDILYPFYFEFVN